MRVTRKRQARPETARETELNRLVFDLRNHITDLQNRGNQLIADQRDLKTLVRSALKRIRLSGDVSGQWVLMAQEMLEKMQ